MTVSKTHINPINRIAQLEQEIASAELERKRIRLEVMVELEKAGLSRRAIGEHVKLSHSAVHQMLAVYHARQDALKERAEAGDK